MATVGLVIDTLLLLSIFLILARIIIDWVQLLAREWRPSGAVAALCEVIFSVTDPPLRAVRAILPPMNLGQVALDLSPIVLLIGIHILRVINGAIFL